MSTRNLASSYANHLPFAFPWVMTIPDHVLAMMLAVLVNGGRPYLSSFAVTMENWDRSVNLWLSQASADYLKGKLPPAFSDLIVPSAKPPRE